MLPLGEGAPLTDEEACRVVALIRQNGHSASQELPVLQDPERRPDGRSVHEPDPPWNGWLRPPPRNMMNPAWPERIDSSRAGRPSRYAHKTGLSPKARSDHVFGQARKSVKCCGRACTLLSPPTISKGCRYRIGRCGSMPPGVGGRIALHVREVGSGRVIDTRPPAVRSAWSSTLVKY